MKKLKICNSCESYTLSDTCGRCGSGTSNPHPPKFSPKDKYGKYRRMLKRRRESKD